MFKRRILALVAGLTIGLPGFSMATMLPDNLENLPSSFAAKTARSDIASGGLENKATIRLTNKVGIFSRYKFPGVSFENVAAKGLSAARSETKSRTIEQLVAVASLRQGIYGVSDGSAGEEATLPSASTEPQGIQTAGTSLRDIAKVLVNKPASGATRLRGGGTINQGGTSFVDIILGTQLDDAFIDAVTDVVTPTVTPDGIIALNFMGLRDFAFLVSPVTNKIQVLDFKTGITLTMSHSAYEDKASRSDEQRRYRPNHDANSNYVVDFRIVRILRAVQSFAENFLLHPLTLGAFLLISLCWGIMGFTTRSG